MFCEKCGNQLKENSKFCIKCGAKHFDDNSRISTEILSEDALQVTKKRKINPFIICGIALILGAAGWYFLNNNKEAKKQFLGVMAGGLNLRSTKDETSKNNIIKEYIFGDSVQILNEEGDWLKVKGIDGNEGFMQKKYLDSTRNTMILSKILQSSPLDSLQTKETRFKKSLISYYKEHNLSTDSWNIKTSSKDYKSIIYGKFNGSNKRGIAILLQNQTTKEQKVVVFLYDDNENEVTRKELNVNNIDGLYLAQKENFDTYFQNDNEVYYTGLAIFIDKSFQSGDADILITFTGKEPVVHNNVYQDYGEGC